MNNLTGIAYKFLEAGLTGKEIQIPDRFLRFQEVFDVPEKPKDWKFKSNKPTDKIAVLVSGGLDSTICYYLAKQQGKEVVAYYMDIGQKYSEKEMAVLTKLGIEFTCLATLSILTGKYSDEWQHIIPARNFIFISQVADGLQGGEIYFGALDGEIKERLGGDKSKAFIQMMREELKALPYPIDLVLPLENYTKETAIEYALSKGIPIEVLRQTVTCFDAIEKQCGKCQACLRRWLAFQYNGIDTMEDYAVNVLENTKPFQEKYKMLMAEAIDKNDFSQYSKRRCEITLNLLNNL